MRMELPIFVSAYSFHMQEHIRKFSFYNDRVFKYYYETIKHREDINKQGDNLY